MADPSTAYLPDVRRRWFGWEARWDCHPLMTDFTRPEDTTKRILRRPTRRWAVAAGTARARRSERRWQRQEGVGEYAWRPAASLPEATP